MGDGGLLEQEEPKTNVEREPRRRCQLSAQCRGGKEDPVSMRQRDRQLSEEMHEV